jgi:hypothetical protein
MIIVRVGVAVFAAGAGGLASVPEAPLGISLRGAAILKTARLLERGDFPVQPEKTARTSIAGWNDGMSPRSDVISEAKSFVLASFKALLFPSVRRSGGVGRVFVDRYCQRLSPSAPEGPDSEKATARGG